MTVTITIAMAIATRSKYMGMTRRVIATIAIH